MVGFFLLCGFFFFIFFIKWPVVAGVLVFLDGFKISGVVKLLLCIQADSFNMGLYSDAERRDACPRATEEGRGRECCKEVDL